MDPMVCLNEDENYEIFSCLDMKELAKCCRISQKWHKFASQDRLWRRWLPESTVLRKMNIKEYINSCAIISLNQLIQRIQEFVDQLPLNEIGVFTCFLPINPINPKCKISMEFRYCGVNFHSQGAGHLKEVVYIFVRTIQENHEFHTDENHLLQTLGLSHTLALTLISHGYGHRQELPIASRVDPILILDEIKWASKRGEFLHHPFGMGVRENYPLYPRECACTIELQV